MVVQIEENYELYEVINAFPILKEKLQNLEFNISDIKEGETIHDFFEKVHLDNDEIKLLIRKMNNEVNLFLKNGEIIKTPENEKQVENLQNEIVMIENISPTRTPLKEENKSLMTQSIDIDEEIDDEELDQYEEESREDEEE